MNWIVSRHYSNKAKTGGHSPVFALRFVIITSIILIQNSCKEAQTNNPTIDFSINRLVINPLSSEQSITTKRIIELDGKSLLVYFDRNTSTVHLKSLYDNSVDSMIIPEIEQVAQYKCWSAPESGIFFTNFLVVDSTGCFLGTEYQTNRIVQICKDSLKPIEVDISDKSISTTYSSIQYDGNKTLIPIRGGKDFFSYSVALVEGLGTSQQQSQFHHPYPNSKLLRDPYLTQTSSILAYDRIYTSFAFDDSLHITDLETGKFWKMKAATAQQLKFQVNENLEPISDRVEHIRKIEYYSHLIHDPYRELFYRVAVVTSDTVLGGIQPTWFHKPWKLLVFNNDLQKLKEVDFTGFDNCYREVLVSREGLYLGKNFIEDYTFLFDTLKFDLFEITVN